MTPEQLKVVRDHYAAQWRFGIVEVLDECIETAEREAKLREAVGSAERTLAAFPYPTIDAVRNTLRAALESKGGSA